MGGPAEPPEGGPEGGAGGEDEFRSVVFDESFIRAARIQEPSATERLSGAHRAVRRRSGRGGLPRQALALMLLIGFAFATAVYMGVRHPYAPPITGAAANLTTQIIPLEPGVAGIPTDSNPIPLGPALGASVTATAGASAGSSGASSASGSSAAGSSASASPQGSGSASASGSTSASASASATTPTSLDPVYAGLPGAEFLAIGSTGFNLPNPRHTDHFSHDQVGDALQVVLGYLVTSSLTQDVVSGHDTDSVRNYVSPGQEAQFNESVTHPQNDQRHLATGWMVRFDPTRVRLATDQVLVAPGHIAYRELDPGTLEVTSDYTFVYALTPAASASASPAAAASGSATGAGAAAGSPSATAAGQQPIVYYAVRRALTFWLTADDIAGHNLQVVDSVVQAGATSCTADNSAFLQPLFPTSQHPTAKPGVRPTPTPVPGAVNPFDHGQNAWSVCGRLSWIM